MKNFLDEYVPSLAAGVMALAIGCNVDMSAFGGNPDGVCQEVHNALRSLYNSPGPLDDSSDAETFCAFDDSCKNSDKKSEVLEKTGVRCINTDGSDIFISCDSVQKDGTQEIDNRITAGDECNAAYAECSTAKGFINGYTFDADQNSDDLYLTGAKCKAYKNSCGPNISISKAGFVCELKEGGNGNHTTITCEALEGTHPYEAFKGINHEPYYCTGYIEN